MRTHTTQTEQVGVFPCRGWVAPCQRAPGSIKGLPLDVNRGASFKRSRWRAARPGGEGIGAAPTFLSMFPADAGTNLKEIGR